MKNKSLAFTILALSTLIISCKKEQDPIPETPAATTYPNYSKLAIGNYWVYQQYDLDTLGNLTAKNNFDSCYVASDTSINGNTYFKLIKPKPYVASQVDVSYLRDSLSYIVNESGKILFSSSDASTIFATNYYTATPTDTLCKVVFKMDGQATVVSTDAGNFNALNAQEKFYMYPNYQSAGSIRFRNYKYAENVGLVTEVLPFFASAPFYTERRLVRYHVN
jgi:hypothetical protein